MLLSFYVTYDINASLALDPGKSWFSENVVLSTWGISRLDSSSKIFQIGA